MDDSNTSRGSGVRGKVGAYEIRVARIAVQFGVAPAEAARFASDVRARLDEGWPAERAIRVLIEHRRKSPLFGWPRLGDPSARAFADATERALADDLLSEERSTGVGARDRR